MALLSKPSTAAKTALLYITIGLLVDIWCGIWYWYLRDHPPADEAVWYVCYGFLLTGLALLVIGLAIGPIGRAARHAELPPEEVTQAQANIDMGAATHANPVVGAVAQPTPQNSGAPRTAPVPVARPVDRTSTPAGVAR
jgi:hypothetical protein